jgi:hypothetical protein
MLKKRFYDIYLLILIVLTIVFCIFIFSGPALTSTDKAKSFMSLSMVGFIVLWIASFHFLYSLLKITPIADFPLWNLSWLILTSAIIPGISPLLFYLLVFRKHLK